MKATCGCCEGLEKVTPLQIANRPGLKALRYRVGTHSKFLETMLARLSDFFFEVTEPGTASGKQLAYPLQALRTRDQDDSAIALLDAWATVAEVLTFYQERLANEGYLRTAVERRSILELAKLVGYKLRPGVAATVYLAFELEKDQNLVIPQGVRAQSIPGPGEMPQSFETSEPLEARFIWNALAPRLMRPKLITLSNAEEIVVLYFKGITTNLKPNDPLLLVFGVGDGEQALHFVDTVEAQAEADRTKVTTQQPPAAQFVIAVKGTVERYKKTSPKGGIADAVVEILNDFNANLFVTTPPETVNTQLGALLKNLSAKRNEAGQANEPETITWIEQIITVLKNVWELWQLSAKLVFDLKEKLSIYVVEDDFGDEPTEVLVNEVKNSLQNLLDDNRLNLNTPPELVITLLHGFLQKFWAKQNEVRQYIKTKTWLYGLLTDVESILIRLRPSELFMINLQKTIRRYLNWQDFGIASADSLIVAPVVDILVRLMNGITFDQSTQQLTTLVRQALPALREKRDLALKRNDRPRQVWTGLLVIDLEDILNARVTAFSKLQPLIEHLLVPPSLQPINPLRRPISVGQTFSSQADIGAQLILVQNPELKTKLYAAWANSSVTPEKALKSVEALRVKAAPFGNNSPLKPIRNSQGATTGNEEWPLETMTIGIRQFPSKGTGTILNAFNNGIINTEILSTYYIQTRSQLAQIEASTSTSEIVVDRLRVRINIERVGGGSLAIT